MTLTGSAGTATATSPAYTPTATGTYCFLGVYSGDSNYTGGSDGSTTRECFTVTVAPPGVTTAPGHSTIVLGNSNTDGHRHRRGRGHPHRHRHLLRVRPLRHRHRLHHGRHRPGHR